MVPVGGDGKGFHATPIVDSFSRLPWQEDGVENVASPGCHLALVAARAPLAARHGVATSVIGGAPPLQMGQQVWSRLRRRPRAACESGHPMADGQWSPLN